MEEPQKIQPSSSHFSGKSKLRYPLRSSSSIKMKEHNNNNNKSPEIANNINNNINSSSATSNRGRNSNMSKSVSVLELSAGKDQEKVAKPPRRLSIPSKSSASPMQKSASNITPISEARSKRIAANGQDRCDTPLSDVSRSSIRKKFNILASASYWLSQVKLSETTAKHSISLGFFKLAHEAGCEQMQRLREELKSYVQRHNLDELGETVRSLFESYEISETFEQLQESVVCSHVPDDATTPGDDVQGTSSTAGTRKFKPKALNVDTQASAAKASSKKENVPKIASVTKMRASVNLDSVKPKSIAESEGTNGIKEKVQKSGKQEANNGEKSKKQDDKLISEEVTAKPLNKTLDGNKENMDAPRIGEVSVTEEN